MKDEVESLDGTVECVIFHNEENGYTVLEVESGGELVTVVGNLPDLNEGDEIRVMGSYVSHRSFGLQFKALSAEVRLPETTASIRKYLSGGAVKGIGPVIANRIVDAFGKDTFDVIEHRSELLAEVKGVSPKKAMEIAEEFKRVFGMRTVMSFLTRFQIPTIKGIRLWKLYGPIALDLLNENPFVLCINDIGVSFADADKIREELEIPPYDDNRIKAGILTTLQKAQWEGHACLPSEELLVQAAAILNMEKALVSDALEVLLEDRVLVQVVVDTTIFVYLADTYETEHAIAERCLLVSEMEESAALTESVMEAKIKTLEAKHGLSYAALQKKAMMDALRYKITILTGGPGTGKTTTLNAMIELLLDEGLKVSLASPTGRAAKRMTDLTGREAKTIHRLLGVTYDEDGRQMFLHNEKNLLSCDVIIIDEVSMVDIFLFESLLAALRLACKIILVGDADQLPPVGVGNVLKELIDSGKIPTTTLNEVFRQAQESLIVVSAHEIIEGRMPNLTETKNDFFFLPRGSAEDIRKTVLELCAERLPKAYDYSPFSDIQVLCPTRVGAVGTTEMNNRLQNRLNPSRDEQHEIRQGAYTFREGDKVMQVRNNYDILWKREVSVDGETEGMGIFNGDIGEILMIDKRARSMKIAFDDRIATYLFEQLSEIELAYAITIHKSQGSEFEAVILPFSTHGGRMHYRNLLYTAVTRAKKLLIIVGSQAAVKTMVENVLTTKKYTNIAYFLMRDSGEN